MKVSIKRYWHFFAFIIMTLVISGCAKKLIHKPLDKKEYAAIDFSDAGGEERWWGDTKPPFLVEGLKLQAEILKKRFPSAVSAKKEDAPQLSTLTISGGGADGAFGAGLLVGWTKSGERPEFQMVTGTSTGAIIAPFAFLGAKYDSVLLEIYSQLTKDKVYESQLLSGIFGGASIADNTFLQQQIEKYITLELIEEIALEHEKARNLFIVTTHFDTMRPMIWHIGGIAAKRNIESVKLIRKIMLASAAIPILFPPVAFDREKDGKHFTELHIDGGVTRNAFSYPAQISMPEIEKIQGLTFNRNVYVIHNGNNKLPYSPAPVDLIGIASRTTLGLLQDKVNSDIERIYYISQRDGIKFNMIEIPDYFVADRAIDFDPKYMNDLLDLGVKIGIRGSFWNHKPLSER